MRGGTGLLPLEYGAGGAHGFLQGRRTGAGGIQSRTLGSVSASLFLNWASFLKFYFFSEREKEEERDRNIDWLPHSSPGWD